MQNNAFLDRSDPRDSTRGGKRLTAHTKSPLGGAGMRNMKARGAVNGLVRTETILMKMVRNDLQS